MMPPLAYFCTSFIGCLMTQIRAFSKRLLDAVQKGHFAEVTLANPIPVKHRLMVNCAFVDAD